jgi:hypothetical protein
VSENGVPEEEPAFYLLPALVRRRLLDYLGTRPYNEVAVGIEWLATLDAAPANVSEPEHSLSDS